MIPDVYPGSHILDPDFYHPGSQRSKKSTGSRIRIRKTDFLSILALLDLLLGQIDVEKRQKNSCRLRYLANDSLQIALPNVRLQILGKSWLFDLKCRKNKHLVVDTSMKYTERLRTKD
jgi:hypothetical protein